MLGAVETFSEYNLIYTVLNEKYFFATEDQLFTIQDSEVKTTTQN